MKWLVAVPIVAGTLTCSNQPPNVPKVRILDYDSKSITIQFDNKCKDPDETGVCTRNVRLSHGGYQDPRFKKVTGAVVKFGGLSPSTIHEVSAYHHDGKRSTFAETILWKTAGATGPKVVGIAPTEVLVPNSQVVVNGIGFKASTSASLLDPVTGASHPAPVLAIQSNRLTVAVPKPSGLSGRKPYFLVTNSNHKVVSSVDKVYLSATSASLPPGGQRIRISFIRWQPSSRCNALLCGQCTEIDGWYPPVRDALRTSAGAPAGDDWWPDQWTDSFWARFKTLADDSSREWAAMCTEAWGVPSHRVGGLEENPAAPRVTLPSGNVYWFSIDFDKRDIYRIAERKRFYNGTYFDFCTETAGQRTMPNDCTNWIKNREGHINVHIVGALLEDGEQIDPAQLRGFTNPPSIFTNDTRGMIILTDNPGVDVRLKTDSPTGTTEECIAHYFKSSDPTGRIYWWGTSHSTESTPNILTHELHHAVTGFVHGGERDPDPCWTPAVGEPIASCGRGFNMDLGGDFTAAEMCEAVVDGWSGHDYTH